MPYDEPNSYGEMSAEDWRETYATYVAEFQKSNRGIAERLQLRINLGRLGYAGGRLDSEIEFINGTAKQ